MVSGKVDGGFEREAIHERSFIHELALTQALRDPKAWNDCAAAWKEWRSSVHRQRPARKTSKEVVVEGD
jgi:hypothetical protein